jgi:hypothetical protein
VAAGGLPAKASATKRLVSYLGVVISLGQAVLAERMAERRRHPGAVACLSALPFRGPRDPA